MRYSSTESHQGRCCSALQKGRRNDHLRSACQTWQERQQLFAEANSHAGKVVKGGAHRQRFERPKVVQMKRETCYGNGPPRI